MHSEIWSRLLKSVYTIISEAKQPHFLFKKMFRRWKIPLHNLIPPFSVSKMPVYLIQCKSFENDLEEVENLGILYCKNQTALYFLSCTSLLLPLPPCPHFHTHYFPSTWCRRSSVTLHEAMHIAIHVDIMQGQSICQKSKNESLIWMLETKMCVSFSSRD